jgi:adenylate cyclase
LLCLAILLIAILIQLRTARWISSPITNLSKQVGQITDLRFDNNFDINSPIQEVLTMSRSLENMQAGLHSFNRYVPSSLVRQLISKGNVAQLGGTKHKLTVLFSDIAGFTSIAEQIEPEHLMHHLSDYLDALSSKILELDGTIDKYIGDAIMCFWGAPITMEDQADKACIAALVCQQTNMKLNQEWIAKGLPALPTRMGIHTGISIVGNIGSSTRLNYTALGDNINLAARLESVNKQYGTFILISEDTRLQLKGEYLTRPVDVVALKGKQQSILIHELIAGRYESNVIVATETEQELCSRFSSIFRLYQEQKWQQAVALLEQLSLEFPKDKLSALYLHRCKQFMAHPPAQDWDGVFRMKTK